MQADFHFHSTFSDGAWDVAELAAGLEHAEVKYAALTDHDTTGGCQKLRKACSTTTIVRGVEISCKHKKSSVHVLVYDGKWSDGFSAIDDLLKKQRELRRKRALAICEKLDKLGAAVSYEQLSAAKSSEEAIGRPDIARALVERGHCTSKREAFDRYLHDGGPADVVVDGLSVGEVATLAHETGCLAVLAHPHHIGDLAQLFAVEYSDRGLAGIEVYYPTYDASQRQRWRSLAKRFDLLQTGGSDFHGPSDRSSLGIDLPDSVFEPFAERLFS